uniref:Uncharacterized protein n=1 Tax=Candidozyma auris TaxID=498019 RepID=A0A0L0NQS8_CANAR
MTLPEISEFKSKLYLKALLSASNVTLKYEGLTWELSMHVTRDVAESVLRAHAGVHRRNKRRMKFMGKRMRGAALNQGFEDFGGNLTKIRYLIKPNMLSEI